MNKRRLEDLQRRRDQINAQIQTLKAKEGQVERKRDTRRKVLIGAAVLEKVKKGEWPEDKLRAMMEIYLTKAIDRELFGLMVKIEGEDETKSGVVSPSATS